MTLAPQSASSRTAVGPDLTRVKSRTVKRSRARDPLGNGMLKNPDKIPLALAGGRRGLTFPDLPWVVY